MGPGRTFADFARDEASRGKRSLRFDFSGFGTSGRGNSSQGGDLYTDEGACDVQAAIEYLHQEGHEQIFGLGFCAGAWSMMQAEAASDLQRMVAINVALYRQPGPAEPELMKRTRRRLANLSPAHARIPLLQGIVARVLRVGSQSSQPVEWLVRMCNAGVGVRLAYAEFDPGLEYLRGQMAIGLCEQVRHPFEVQTYSGLGHLAEGPSARERLFHDISDYFARADLEGHCQSNCTVGDAGVCEVGPGHATPSKTS